MREHILNEIRRLAEKNKGLPPGEKTFATATGIHRREWHGKYWARWGDACAEAGFTRNTAPQKIENELILQKLAEAFSQAGRVMTDAELNLYRRQNSGFPAQITIHKSFPKKPERLIKLAEWIKSSGKYQDVAKMLEQYCPPDTHTASTSVEGYVYLLKSGPYFKIGRSDNIERRVRQIGQAAVEPINQVHVIRTDDPVGIEAYWHRRFSDRQTNGEWFKLVPADIAAFKRRRFQ